MSKAEGRGRGVMEVLGGVLSLAVGSLIGWLAWRSVVEGAPLRWFQVGLGVTFVVVHLLLARRSVSFLCRGLVSTAVVAAAIAAAVIGKGVEAEGTAVALGLTLAHFARATMVGSLALGAGSLLYFPTGWPKRVLAGLIGLLLLIPWILGVWVSASPAEILGGTHPAPSTATAAAVLAYVPNLTWPWYAQPAFVSAVVLLAALLAGMVALGAEYQRQDRNVLWLALVANLLAPGAITAKYVLFLRAHEGALASTSEPPRPASPVPASTDHALYPPDSGVAHPPPTASSSPPLRVPGSDRYDCSRVVFPDRDVAAIRAGYEPRVWRKSALAFLAVRYPDASWMVESLKDPKHFDVWLEGQTGSWDPLIRRLSTAVHEASHMAGLQQLRGRRHVYVLGENESLVVQRRKTMARSEIASRLPPAVRDQSYTKTYLEGKSGAQGFEMILEELNAYTWSLYTAVAVLDGIPPNVSTSDRDGLLTFMVYVDVYLALAREEHPKTYRVIEQSKDLRAAVVKLWDRAACVIGLSQGFPRLGIHDDAVFPHVFGEKALEVDLLRTGEK